MAKKISYNDIQNINEDWALDPRNNYPYSGRSVQKFIKDTLNEKAGDFYYDADSSKYLIFADADSRNLYLSDRERYQELLLGSFDAPANYTAKVTVTSPLSNLVLSGSTGNTIDYTFTITDKDGGAVADEAVVTYTFNTSGNIRKVTQVYSAGTPVSFLIDSYLLDGVNNISIVVTGRNTLASAMAVVRFTVIALKFTSTYDFSKPITQGNEIGIPYSLEGAGVKVINWYIDGVLHHQTTVTDPRKNATEYINTSSMEYGKHNVQARTYITSNDENFYSNTIYYDFVVAPSGENWQTNATYILLGLVLDEPKFEGLSITIRQYEDFEYQASVYDSRNRALELVVSDNGTPIQSITSHSKELLDLSFSPTTTGTHALTFSADTASAEIDTDVEESEVNINEVTDGLVLKLSAKGRSNSESNPATWNYGEITTTFSSGFKWNEQSGWNNGVLVIKKNDYIQVNYAPLATDPKASGRTIEIEYETANIEDDDASVVSLVNSSTNAGLSITASSAKLQSSSGKEVDTKYRDGDRVKLAFIINRSSGENACLLFIVNNGVLERATNYNPSDSFLVTSPNNGYLKIGSTGCTVKVHSIRVYNRALTVDEAFCNYAIDSDNILSIADKNNIINDSTHLIDADKVNAKIPILIITGNIQPILDATTSSTEVFVDVEYRNMQDATKNFTATHLRMRPQGTSSLIYPRKNLRLYTASKYNCDMRDANGEKLTNGLYAFKDNSQPVNCWTLKADYAESSGSHNTGVARMWNDLMYSAQIDGEYKLRTEAQKTALENEYFYDVRTTVDGFPIVVFQRNDENSQLVCLGQYNFNNDKSTEKVFGFTDIPGFDNSNVQCFEVLDSSNAIALFTDVSNFDSGWSSAFESRYPDTSEPNLAPLKTLATWINSCQNNQSEWNTNKANHFDLYKLAAYYVYLMRFGAVDQTVKNAMMTTEDGVHWFFINYDNDTVLGIDNNSKVFNAWDYDRNSTVPVSGEYYYAGHASVLWNCFENDDDCMELVQIVDDALYEAGLTYANLVRTFDVEQCNKWCERIYNDNGAYKYIQPYIESEAPYLHMLQGSRKSYRHWWLQHRMNKYDALWVSGSYTTRQIFFKFNSVGSGFTKHSITITSAIDSTYIWGKNGHFASITPVDVDANESYTFDINEDVGVGNPIDMYNANNLSAIQIAYSSIPSVELFDMSSAIGYVGESSLKSIILGDGVQENNVLTSIGGLAIQMGLEEIDIRNFKGITGLNLSRHGNLHTLKAAGSNLAEFAPANGATLTYVSLPSALQSLKLNGTDVTSFVYTPTKTLVSVELNNVIGSWDAKSFVNTWLALFTDEELQDVSLSLQGINWGLMTYAQVLKMGMVGTRDYSGKVSLQEALTETQYNTLVEIYGIDAFSPDGQFVIDCPTAIFISGARSVLAGYNYTYTATIFPIQEGTTIKYILFNGSSPQTPQTDGQGRVYRTLNGFTLYEASGVAIVDSGVSAQSNVTFKLEINGTILDVSATIAVKPLTFPSSVSISGSDTITTLGNFSYTKSFVGAYTANLIDVTWELSPSNGALRLTSDPNADTATLNLAALPSSAQTATLYCTARFDKPNGVETIVGTKSVSIALIPITSFNVSGISRIVSTGQYEYTITNKKPDNYNIDIASMAVSLSTTTATIAYSIVDNSKIILNVTALPSSNEQITLTALATLSNGSYVASSKQIDFGEFTGIDATYEGNGSTAVTILGSTSNVSSMSIDGATAISPSLTYTFNDTAEHTIHFNMSSAGASAMNNLFNGSAVKDVAIGGDMYYVKGLSDCANLRSITLTHGVTNMQDANTGVPNIERLYICDTLTQFNAKSVGESPVTHIEVDENNSNFSSALGNCIVHYTGILMLASNNFELPESITKIGAYAYAHRKSGDLTIPSRVTEVGEYAFAGSEITSVSWGTGCNAIPASCFRDCPHLKNVYIPSNVTSIGSAAFYTAYTSTSPLEKVTTDSVSNWINIAFSGNSSNPIYYTHHLYDTNNNEITSVTFPDGTTSIKSYVFYNCEGLQSVTIPSSVTTIGVDTFSGCSNISVVNISSLESWFGITMSSDYDSPISYGANLYINGQALTTITVPSTVTQIKNYALFGCGCTEIVLHNSITSIGQYAFKKTNITSITFPTSITSIPNGAVQACEHLASVTIPANVTSIGGDAFNGCYLLSQVTCLKSAAPTANYPNPFFNVGRDVEIGTTKSLNVPSGATGYTSGYWKTGLIDTGFTLNATL